MDQDADFERHYRENAALLRGDGNVEAQTIALQARIEDFEIGVIPADISLRRERR